MNSNNVPDPLLAGKELPTFKFELEKSPGKVIGGSVGREATVEQLSEIPGIGGKTAEKILAAVRGESDTAEAPASTGETQ